jgi:predicted Zn-dependent protease
MRCTQPNEHLLELSLHAGHPNALVPVLLFLSFVVTSAICNRYGLGQICMKQEKAAEALAHYQQAARINPGSSVLRCCCGSALRKMNHLAEALRQLKVCGCKICV